MAVDPQRTLAKMQVSTVDKDVVPELYAEEL